MSKTTLFIIEEDHENRRLLRESFKAADYKVSLAIDEEDALERAAAGCLKADLVLINLLGKSLDEVLEIGRTVCRVGKLNTPLVVIAQKYGEELEGTNARIGENEYITYIEDGEQLFDLVACLTA